jgi:hypothetical protein
LKPGSLSTMSDAIVSTAKSGISPTMERTRIGKRRPSGRLSTS